MNANLAILFRMNELNAEKTMLVLKVVLVHDTDLASSRQTRAFGRLHINEVSYARAVIREFTSHGGLFHIDHPAWQLGIDTTALPDSLVAELSSHECGDEDLTYQGHYLTPGRGSAHRCVCGKMWSKIGNTYVEAEAISAAS